MLFGAQWWDDSPEEAAKLARLLDKTGYDFLWHADSHVPFKDVYSYMTLYSLNSSRIRVAAGVSNLSTRDPTVVAASISTVNLISHGRAVLGLGRGDNAVRAIGLEPMEVDLFRKKTRLVKALCAGEEVEYRGKGIKLAWSRGRVPLYIAAYGPKMLEFAGRIADGVILQIGEPSILRWMMKYVKRGAEKARRDIREIDFAVFTAFYASDDLKSARDRVRYYPRIVSNHVSDLLEHYSGSAFPSKLLMEIKRIKGTYDHLEHSDASANHESLVSDELVDGFTIAGDSESCKSKIRELEKLGISHVNLYLPDGVDKEKQLKIFAEQVMPDFR